MRRLGAFVLAAATLSFEITLIRVFSLAQGYHFAFMTISIALLGLGAGGTLLAVWLQAGERSPGSRDRKKPVSGLSMVCDGILADLVLVLASLGFAVATLGGYLIANWLPLDLYRIAWERTQVLLLLAYYLALTIPFVCSGLVIGLLLEGAGDGHVIYAINLIGSATGILGALLALSYLGGPGTVVLSALSGCVAAGLFALHGRWRRRGQQRMVLLLSALCALCMLGIVRLFPSWLAIRLSPYRPLSYALQYPGVRVLSSRWNAYSRVDVVDSTAIHVSPGLSLGYTGQLPVQRGLYVDGFAQAPILSADSAATTGWTEHLPVALAFHLRPRSDVLIMESGGGLDAVIAQSHGAAHITVIASNSLVTDAVQRFGKRLYSGGDVTVIGRSPRSYVRSTPRRFDVVDVALNDAQQTVVSGAYTLNEDYRYTVDAISDYLAVLEPDGILALQRWLQTPPSESLRAWALVVEAIEQMGWSDPRDGIVAIRSWSTMLILVKRGNYTASELQTVREFCTMRQFDLVYLPDVRAEEVNLYNVYEGAPYFSAFHGYLNAHDRGAFHAAYEYDVRPVTDDKPFFFHFFKWRQVPEILQLLGHTWQPFGGGGYLVLIALLLIATMASGGLILFPLAFRKGTLGEMPARSRVGVLAYFGCLGMAYLAIEIPLIQRFVLFLDHPTIAFATIVSILLVASGIGSLLSPWLRARWAIPVLVLLVLLLLVVLPFVFDRYLGYPLAIRMVVSCALLAPLGFLMGVPFPAGLAIIRGRLPGLVPWAWAVNGCTSVIASVLTALIALSWGFSVVLVVAAVGYACAWALLLMMEHRRSVALAQGDRSR